VVRRRTRRRCRMLVGTALTMLLLGRRRGQRCGLLWARPVCAFVRAPASALGWILWLRRRWRCRGILQGRHLPSWCPCDRACGLVATASRHEPGQAPGSSLQDTSRCVGLLSAWIVRWGLTLARGTCLMAASLSTDAERAGFEGTSP
jgi:hypothetical protein